MSSPRTTGTNDRANASWRSGAVLALCVLAAVTLLGAIERLTAERIAAVRATRLAGALADVMPDIAFDNDPTRDHRPIRTRSAGGDVSVYPLRLGERTVGAVLGVVTRDGYGGPIGLLVGIDANARVVGVRVTGHRETPGLGDRIERRRSDWILGFDGRTLDADDPGAWRVSRDAARRGAASDRLDPPGESGGGDGADDGGGFDALTGATITSRAVVDAVRDALIWFEANRDTALAEERPR